ncbi:hypothetical protein NDU88_004251 [Pleurodeles waltl]|uniref:Uncharacterized protein n=1 Tax=Pleurodeles waltl TaxID=8319 RepID=A0AAV7V2I5_PLEWA|nr:hypothetical protein NDU88_004251 [Pleurodeles waltl]
MHQRDGLLFVEMAPRFCLRVARDTRSIQLYLHIRLPAGPRARIMHQDPETSAACAPTTPELAHAAQGHGCEPDVELFTLWEHVLGEHEGGTKPSMLSKAW